MERLNVDVSPHARLMRAGDALETRWHAFGKSRETESRPGDGLCVMGVPSFALAGRPFLLSLILCAHRPMHSSLFPVSQAAAHAASSIAGALILRPHIPSVVSSRLLTNFVRSAVPSRTRPPCYKCARPMQDARIQGRVKIVNHEDRSGAFV